MSAKFSEPATSRKKNDPGGGVGMETDATMSIQTPGRQDAPRFGTNGLFVIPDSVEVMQVDAVAATMNSRNSQHEILYNKLMPYGASIPEEAAAWLAEIKENLAKCVLAADYRPGVLFWLSRLDSYIRLYGRLFPKEDHINFIKLFMELMLDPNMDPSLISRFIRINCDLLAKLELLSPDDLTIDWRPLYKLLDRVSTNRDQTHGVLFLPDRMEDAIIELVGYARYYFPLSATQEMLDEWRPMLCPFAEDTMAKAMNLFSNFLPSMLKPEHSKYGYELWLEEFLSIWLSFPSVPLWEYPLLMLFSRIAGENIGYIAWDKYVTPIFTKFLRTLELPIGKKQLSVTYTNESFDRNSAVLLSVSLIHLEPCLVSLERLFKSVEPFFHPSNYGQWSDRLSSILMSLPVGIVARIQLERFRPNDWMPDVPKESRLTDEQIVRFVCAFKPIALLNLFSKHSQSEEAIDAVRNLALMAPDEIIPDILDKFYAAVENLTEPTRFLSIIAALSACLPYLFNYKDGRKHVVPLMMALLPAVDSNDMKKTFSSLQIFSNLALMIPLRPCVHDDVRNSSSVDLSSMDAEREVCDQSLEFEDIFLQLMDRCLTLVDAVTVEPGARSDTAKNPLLLDIPFEHSMIKIRMELLWHAVFIQAGDGLATLLIDKLYSSVSTGIFHHQQLGALVRCSIGQIALKVRPEIAKVQLYHRIIRLLNIRLDERPNIMEQTTVDDEMLWTLRFVADCTSSGRAVVLEYLDQLSSILRRTLMMKCHAGHKIACQLLRAVLVTTLRTMPTNYHEPPEKVFGVEACKNPADLWGKRITPDQLKVEWYVPTAETIEKATAFFEEFIEVPMQNLKKWVAGEVVLEDRQLQKNLHVIEALFGGAATHCSFDWEDVVQFEGYELESPKQQCPITMAEPMEVLPFGKKVRPMLADIIHQVVDRLLSSQQDHTKSTKTCLIIYRSLLMNAGTTAEEAQAMKNALDRTKMELDNRLSPKKLRYRSLFIQKVRVQHEARCAFQRATRVTKVRLGILRSLVKLSVSRYKEVRASAQSIFTDATAQLQLSYRIMLDDVLNYLESAKDQRPENDDAQLKGSLYLLLGNKKNSYILRHDWPTISKVLPALVRAHHSELPTVTKLLDSIAQKCEQEFVTTGIYSVPVLAANKIAGEILGTMNKQLEVVFDYSLTIQQKIDRKNAMNVELYQKTVNDLVDLLRASQTRIKNFMIGHVFLSYFIRNDIAPPISAVHFTLEHLLDANDKTRRSAILLLVSILRAIKQKRNKIKICQIHPCRSVTGEPLPPPTTIGIREDNLWLCVSEDRLPRTAEDYDNTVFIDKVWIGFYGWPKDELEVSAPPGKQTSPEVMLASRTGPLAEIDKAIFERFHDAGFVERWMRLVGVEDDAHELFDTDNFLLHRALVRHFGYKIVPLFLPHLQRMVTSREEHQQRGACEVLTAFIRGSKRWPFKEVSALWNDLIPIIQAGLNNITSETQVDWCAFAGSTIGYGDMRQTFPLLQAVMQLSPNDTGFQTTSKLAVIYSIFEAADWRRRDLYYKILDMVEPRMTDSYREHVAMLISMAFRHEVNMPRMETRIDQGPKASDFFAKYYPKCLPLMSNEIRLTTLGELNLFKTIVKSILTHVSSLVHLKPDIFKFYPLLCRFENDPRDADLAGDCERTLICFSQVFLSDEVIPLLLSEVRSVVLDNNMPWRARVVALDNLQICVFNNLLTILDNPQWVKEVAALIMDRMLDDQIEVRQMAAVAMTGFIQCSFIPMDKQLIEQFRKWASTKLSRDRSSQEYSDAVIKRHAGVLGLSACVAAYPYAVPQPIPQILMDLGEHINDPPMISATVRNTFSEFRRTHHDSWREHKEKFSDDQLALLTDLLVSPNYYA